MRSIQGNSQRDGSKTNAPKIPLIRTEFYKKKSRIFYAFEASCQYYFREHTDFFPRAFTSSPMLRLSFAPQVDLYTPLVSLCVHVHGFPTAIKSSKSIEQ